MVRIPQITERDDLPSDKQHIFDAIANSRGGVVVGPFPVLLNSPELAGRMTHLGTYLRFESTLPPESRELAILTASREVDCEFEWGPHVIMARQAGVREEAIEVVANRSPADSLTEDEARVVQYGRELLREHRVSDATYDAVRDHFGNQGLLDLTVLIGYYAMLGYTLNAVELEPLPNTPQLP